jgi:glutamate racemase
MTAQGTERPDTARIGVFDSGVGGITVLTELIRRFPGAEFHYYGDTANVPYGTKSPAQVERLCAEAALQLRSRALDALVVACNTASSLALPAMRASLAPVPVHGVVEPGARAAAHALRNPAAPVLVLATRATARSHAYANTLQALLGPAARVLEQACPLLVPMIEEGWTDHPILRATIREYVKPHLALPPGVALLGCTHYPWIQAAIAAELPDWTVVNSAQAIADAVEPGLRPRGANPTRVVWHFTDAEAVPAFARELTRRTSWDEGRSA